MTDQINLELIWADSGGITAVTPAKYVGGWVSEIPTYQNFNYMVQGLDQNTLHLAESSYFDWQVEIAYTAGARVVSPLGGTFTAKGATTGQDPDTDPGNGSWVHGWLVGSDFGSLLEGDGLKVEIPERSTLLYTGVDQAIVNRNPMLELRTTTASDNWAIGNVAGEVVFSNLGQAGPDDADLAKDAGDTHRAFHEGHLPLVDEVVGAVEEAPADTKLYARSGVSAVDGNWVVVTTTSVKIAPPPPVTGAGQGWYNLDEGQFYVDINDGDSSQWVLANPPTIVNYSAPSVEYDNSGSSLTSTNVKDALDEIATRLDALEAFH